MSGLVTVLVLGGLLLLFAFGPRRGGRKLSMVEKVIGIVLIAYIAFGATIALAWNLILGDGACLMGQCSGSPSKRPPATEATTLDGRWYGHTGNTEYTMDVTQSGTSVTGTGTRGAPGTRGSEGAIPVTVSGTASLSGIRLNLGGVVFTGEFVDAETILGHVPGADGEERLRMSRHGPSRSKAQRP